MACKKNENRGLRLFHLTIFQVFLSDLSQNCLRKKFGKNTVFNEIFNFQIKNNLWTNLSLFSSWLKVVLRTHTRILPLNGEHGEKNSLRKSLCKNNLIFFCCKEIRSSQIDSQRNLPLRRIFAKIFEKLVPHPFMLLADFTWQASHI